MRFDKFTERAQEAAQRCVEIIQRYGYNQIDTEHMLLALLEQDSGIIPKILKKLKVNSHRLIAHLDATLRARPSDKTIDYSKNQIFITPRVKHIIDLSNKEADRMKDEYVSTEHIFLAILTEQNTPTSRILENAGLRFSHDKVDDAIVQIQKPKRQFSPAEKSLPTKEQISNDPRSNSNKETTKKNMNANNNVFIVHGHDDAMKEAVARMIEKLGLTAIVLHEKPNQGKTIIEKFTEYADVGFAIVLLSPDDVATSKHDPVEKKSYRARQNAIFELGFFIGRLGRERVISLYRQTDGFELPSDYSGVVFIPFDDYNRWKFDIIRELKASGYKLDANKLLE